MFIVNRKIGLAIGCEHVLDIRVDKNGAARDAPTIDFDVQFRLAGEKQLQQPMPVPVRFYAVRNDHEIFAAFHDAVHFGSPWKPLYHAQSL